MKKLITLCALFLLIIQGAHANNVDAAFKDGTITGKVMDATLNEPLPYVNVIVKNEKNETVTGGITLDNGNFKITKVPEGTYTVAIQYIGYKSVEKVVEISRKKSRINLGTIELKEDAAELDAVTVVAEVSTIQQKVDRKVITVGKDLTTSGATAAEIMNNLPSVNVDQQSGDISLRGNQNVRVMVDGKLSNIPASQLLKQIPSTSIKSIELITNPSAKYNPEGMSGIINIVLHKNTNIGFNGNLNVGIAYDEEPKFNSSLDMNYRNGKVNMYGSYSNNIANNYNFGNIDRIEQQINQSFNILDNNKSHLFKVGLDYYLNDKHTISVFTNQNLFDGWTKVNTRVDYALSNLSELQRIDGDNKNRSQQYNFNYKFDINDSGHTIELEADYNNYDGESYDFNDFTASRPDFFQINDTDRNRTTINLDYTNPLSETSKLELGLEARLFENTIFYESDAREVNEAGEYIPTTTNFDYSRDIYSAYATYGNKYKKFSYQVGLRAETVQVESDAFKKDLDSGEEINSVFDNDYFEIYPSAFFTYTASEKNSYQLSYSRRVDRPGVGQVNPLPEWNTALISQFGNQELRPQFTNSIEANYTRQLGKGSITAGVFYRAIEDEIQQAVRIDRSDYNRLILTNLNFDNSSAYGIEVSTNYRPTKWWSINGSFDLFSQTQKSIGEFFANGDPETATEEDILQQTFEVDNVVWNVRMFNNFRVNKSLSFSAFGMYRGKNKTIQFDMEPMLMVNVGMRYTFLEGKANFSLNYNDIFNTMFAEFSSTNPLLQRGQFNWESQQVSARLSYRFGGGKYRAKSRKRRDNDEKQGGGMF